MGRMSDLAIARDVAAPFFDHTPDDVGHTVKLCSDRSKELAELYVMYPTEFSADDLLAVEQIMDRCKLILSLAYREAA
jgi:hypothetical protein